MLMDMDDTSVAVAQDWVLWTINKTWKAWFLKVKNKWLKQKYCKYVVS